MKSKCICVWVAFLMVGSIGCKATEISGKSAKPKNVILLIGDGMGFEQVKAAGMFAHGQAGSLFMETLPHQGQMTTHAADKEITDSASIRLLGWNFFEGFRFSGAGFFAAGERLDFLSEVSGLPTSGDGAGSSARSPIAASATTNPTPMAARRRPLRLLRVACNAESNVFLCFFSVIAIAETQLRFASVFPARAADHAQPTRLWARGILRGCRCARPGPAR